MQNVPCRCHRCNDRVINVGTTEDNENCKQHSNYDRNLD